MDAADLKLEFDKQVKDADLKIAEAEKQLAQLKEYKTKLLGGLETLELLNPKTEEQGGVPEPSTVPQTPVSSQENGLGDTPSES
tara:strand:+ start:530 stop:781 length:252 start_codon:yes stop_codon:yes gene_type:complete